MTRLSPTKAGYLVDPARPVVSMAVAIEGVHRVEPHTHPRGQLIYTAKGGVRVVGGSGSWVVPPNQAVWIAPAIEHEVIAHDSVLLYCLFVDPSAAEGLPRECSVVALTPLLRELIIKAVEIGNEPAVEGPHGRLMAVILDQLRELPAAPLHLPMARDKRLQRVLAGLVKDPSDGRGLEEWASVAGASARTLARLFVKETGLTFSQWRKQARLFKAIDRLGQGQTVTAVAIELGYESPSAFIAMFRRTLGMSPGRYFRRQVEVKSQAL